MKRLLASIFIALLSLLFFTQNAYALTPQKQERLIVKFKPLLPLLHKEVLIRGTGANLSEELRLRDTYIVTVPSSIKSRVIDILKRNVTTEYVEEDYVASKLEIPNDPYLSNQWGLEKIQAYGAWDVTHGTSDTDIAIVDTGINSNHPDLSAKIAVSVNCTISSSCPNQATTDPDGHGTHVAGIASAVTNNSIGVAGVSWEGTLMSVKVLDDTGSGYYSWVADGIIWAADNGAKVINLSLGGSSSSSTLKNAIDYAWGKGVVIVAAAGNSGNRRALYPAYYTNSIAVAATDTNDRKASFSSYGGWVDVAAPGVSIFSTYQNGYSYLSGTSMATPYVTGLAALLFGQNPGWTNSQVRDRIESTAEKISGTGSYWAYGRIDVCKAVGCGVSPTVTPTESPTPTPTPTPTPSPTPTPTPSPTPTATPTPTVTSTPTPTVTPTPTPSPKPWWCRYFPTHRLCQ